MLVYTDTIKVSYNNTKHITTRETTKPNVQMRKLHPFICLTFSHKYIYTYTTAQLSALAHTRTHAHTFALQWLQGVRQDARRTKHFLERNTIAIITIHSQRYKTQQHGRPEGVTAGPSLVHPRSLRLLRRNLRSITTAMFFISLRSL